MSPESDQLRRLRPFRVGAYGLYLIVAVGFSLLILVSVTRSVLGMTPSRPPTPVAVLSEAACREQAQALWIELDGKRRTLTDFPAARRADQGWSTFRLDWLIRLRGLEARCGIEREERRSLAVVFSRLDKLLDLYTTHVVQYAGEIGPTVDELRRVLDGGVAVSGAPVAR